MAIKKARERGKSRSLEHEVPRTPGWEKKKKRENVHGNKREAEKWHDSIHS